MWRAQSKSISSSITNTHSSWNIQKAKLSFDSFSCKHFVLKPAAIKITPEIFLALVCSLLPGFYLKEEHGLGIGAILPRQEGSAETCRNCSKRYTPGSNETKCCLTHLLLLTPFPKPLGF